MWGEASQPWEGHLGHRESREMHRLNRLPQVESKLLELFLVSVGDATSLLSRVITFLSGRNI
jgi:hypothetical protein